KIGNLVFLELTLDLLDFSFEIFLALQQLADFVDCIIGVCAEEVAYLFELLFIAPYEIQGALSRKGFDASYTGGYSAFERKLEDANFAGTMDVGSTAQFCGEITDFHHADAIPILISEESEGAFADGVFVTRLADRHIRVITNMPIDMCL